MSPENKLSIVYTKNHIAKRFTVKQRLKGLVGLDFLAFSGQGLTLCDLGGIFRRHGGVRVVLTAGAESLHPFDATS